MFDKVTQFIESLTQLSGELDVAYTKGVVNGFTEESETKLFLSAHAFYPCGMLMQNKVRGDNAHSVQASQNNAWTLSCSKPCAQQTNELVIAIAFPRAVDGLNLETRMRPPLLFKTLLLMADFSNCMNFDPSFVRPILPKQGSIKQKANKRQSARAAAAKAKAKASAAKDK